MDILYLPLEFGRWYSAKKLAYPVGVGMIDGFEGNKIQHLTIPLMYHDDIWLKHIKEIVGDRKFDQVWLEVVHSVIPEGILEWLSSLAPIRVGFVIESLSIAPEEFTDNPIGTQRRIDNLNQKLPYLTDIVVYDIRDLHNFHIPTMLGNMSVPERLVKTPNSTADKAIFYGTAYGVRGEWLRSLKSRLIINPPSAEDAGNFPRIFEQLFAFVNGYTPVDYSYFFRNWYYVRQSVYSIWINHLHTLPGCAMISLPHRTQVLSGRVIESMAAGKPVVSQLLNTEMDDLFEDGKEILYYKDMFGLLNCLDRLQSDSDLRFYLAEAARVKVLENHTTEVQVKKIIEFVGGD